MKTPSSTHLQLLERKNTFIFPRQRPATADVWQLLPATRIFQPEWRENPRTWPSALPGGRKRAASSPSGATACVSQTQEAPGLGQGELWNSPWNCALWAKLPNTQACKAEENKSGKHICAGAAFSETRADKPPAERIVSVILRGISHVCSR